MRGRKEMETFEQLPSQQNPVTPQPLAAAPGISRLSFPNEWHTWPGWLLGCSIPLEPAAYRFLVSWDISAVPSGTMCPLNAWGHLLPKSHLGGCSHPKALIPFFSESRSWLPSNHLISFHKQMQTFSSASNRALEGPSSFLCEFLGASQVGLRSPVPSPWLRLPACC